MSNSELTQHQLIKIQPRKWHCRVCLQTWRGKPRKPCPGCPIVEYDYALKDKYWQIDSLKSQNLRPITKACCVEEKEGYTYFYDKEGQTEVIDPHLPPVVEYDSYYLLPVNLSDEEPRPARIYDGYAYHSSEGVNLALKSAIGLKKLNLVPNGEPAAVTWLYDKFIELYDLKNTRIYRQDLPEKRVFDRNRYYSLDGLEAYNKRELLRENLKPKSNAAAVAAEWNYEEFDLLYRIEDCEIYDPNLPPLYFHHKIPQDLYKDWELSRFNRRADSNTPKSGCFWSDKPTAWLTLRQSCFNWLYKIEDCPIRDESLPPCYPSEALPEHLSSEWGWQQKQPLYELKPDAVAAGCMKIWSDRFKKYELILLYDFNQLQLHDRDISISKTKLKQFYKLPDSWIAKLGKPDLLEPNPINPYYAPTQLYSRSRIEQYLAENADAYTEHLAKRKTYLAIFEKNRDKLLSPESKAKAQKTKRLKKKISKVTEQFNWNANNKLIREQSVKCLKCASGFASDRGFLCAINPFGLVLKQLPCPDWQERQS